MGYRSSRVYYSFYNENHLRKEPQMRLLRAAYILSLNAWLMHVDPLGIVMDEVVHKDLVEPILDDIFDEK